MAGEYLPPVVTRLTAEIDDVLAKIEELKAAIKTIKTAGVSVPVNFEVNKASWTKAQATAQAMAAKGVTIPVRFDVNAAGAAGAGAVARAFGGLGGAGVGFIGWLMRLGRTDLFGGVLGGVLATVGGIHLLIDGIAEVGAILIPVAIALAGFGIAASDAVTNIYNRWSAMNTIMDATGKVIPPMTGQMNKLRQSIQPQVYGMLGDALTVINDKSGELTGVIKGTSDALSYFAARITAALTSQGMSAFLKNAVGDLKGLFDVFGNIAGTIGAVLKNLPGYAQTILHVLVDVTGAMERLANTSVGQGIIHFGLAFHGAFIYIGLLATGLARLIPVIIGWLSKLAYAAARGAEAIGFDSMAAGLYRLGGAAEVAAGLSWGWVAVAAAAVGVLAYAITTAKTATQQWIAASQQAVNNANAGNGLTAIAKQQTAATNQLINAYQKQVQTQGQVNQSVKAGGPGARYAIQYSQQLGQNTSDLRNYQSRLSQETDLYNSRLGVLANKYGGAKEASELLTMAGVKMGQMISKNGQQWKIVQQMVSGVVQGYAAMGQRSGTLGADLYVITQQASIQYQAMQKLNQAWSTFISNVTGLETSWEGAVQGLRAVTSEASKTGATFTGVNARSVTLQNTFETQLIPQVQGVIQGMRQGGASSTDMAHVISTILNPAVHEGALQNQGFRTQIYDMARQAGYTGPNAIRPLTGFIDSNRRSLQNAAGAVNNYDRALGRIPNPERLMVDITGKAQMAIASGLQRQLPGPRAARGAYVGVGSSGTADDVLARVSKGELIVPAHMVQAGVVNHLKGKIPGFAGGGFVADYRGGLGGLTPWLNNDYRAISGAMASQAANAFSSAFAGMMGGPSGGRASAGGQYNRSMLENLWQQAGGPGGYIALIAAAIALAESGGSPIAHNPSGASGLWQILGQVYPGNIFNPYINALNAVKKYDMAGGFSPWVTYTTGAYRQFMDGGGWLMPGRTMVENNTGRPERVLAPNEDQGGDIVIQLDGREIARVSQAQARRYNRRNGPRGTDKWAKPA